MIQHIDNSQSLKIACQTNESKIDVVARSDPVRFCSVRFGSVLFESLLACVSINKSPGKCVIPSATSPNDVV